MRDIWLISDTHFGHNNILKFTGYDGKPVRPGFESVTDMDETMIRNWNSMVKENHIVYHLGDVYFGSSEKADEILGRLNGSKRLILGNHDNGKDPVLLKHFKKIVSDRYFKEYGLLLSHRPLHKFDLKPGERNVHGHIHQNIIDDPTYVNMCVEHRNYTPTHITEI